jgi:hypothetical protein
MNGPSSLTMGRASPSIPAAVLDPGGPRTLEEMQRRAQERRARYVSAVIVASPQRLAPSNSLPDRIEAIIAGLTAEVEFLRATVKSQEIRINKQDELLDRVMDEVRESVSLASAYRRIDKIIEASAAHFQVSFGDIIGSRRTAGACMPRHIAMYLAKTLTVRSLPEIGRRIGNRDHTTILHGIRKIEALLLTDDALRADVEAIKEALAG